MRYEGKLYRPPSEADALIVQATIGCSWNHCTYCDMYREKTFRVRDLAATPEDLDRAGSAFGDVMRRGAGGRVRPGLGWLEDQGRWHAGLDGRPAHVFGTLRRIDERKEGSTDAATCCSLPHNDKPEEAP